MKFFLANFLFLPLAVIAANTNTLPALAPAYDPIPPTFWEQHGTAIIIGSLTLLAIVSVVVWRHLQPKPPVVVPPELLARRALTKLQGRPEDGKTLSDVSQIVRRYFSTVLQLPPGELTTAEFNFALARNDNVPVELGEAILRFLRECDERKFSSAKVAVPVNAVPRALELISLAEQHHQPTRASR